MRIVYTRHAQEKLDRKDIKALGITKGLINQALSSPQLVSRTKYGDWANLRPINAYTLRVIYDKIELGKVKVITFHIAKKGRYESKVLQRR